MSTATVQRGKWPCDVRSSTALAICQFPISGRPASCVKKKGDAGLSWSQDISSDFLDGLCGCTPKYSSCASMPHILDNANHQGLMTPQRGKRGFPNRWTLYHRSRNSCTVLISIWTYLFNLACAEKFYRIPIVMCIVMPPTTKTLSPGFASFTETSKVTRTCFMAADGCSAVPPLGAWAMNQGSLISGHINDKQRNWGWQPTSAKNLCMFGHNVRFLVLSFHMINMFQLLSMVGDDFRKGWACSSDIWYLKEKKDVTSHHPGLQVSRVISNYRKSANLIGDHRCCWNIVYLCLSSQTA